MISVARTQTSNDYGSQLLGLQNDFHIRTLLTVLYKSSIAQLWGNFVMNQLRQLLCRAD